MCRSQEREGKMQQTLVTYAGIGYTEHREGKCEGKNSFALTSGVSQYMKNANVELACRGSGSG